MNEYKNIVQFIFEAGAANEVENVGWELLKAEKSSFLSMHSFRSAIIGFILAKLEGVKDPFKLAFFCLVHKFYKVRLGDRHKVTASYIDFPPEVKQKVKADQYQLLGEDIKKTLDDNHLSTDEKIIIEDADQLQLAFEAKELLEKGYGKAQIWLDRIGQVIRTKSAKEIFRNLLEMNSSCWWEGMKKAPRTKLEDYIDKE